MAAIAAAGIERAQAQKAPKPGSVICAIAPKYQCAAGPAVEDPDAMILFDAPGKFIKGGIEYNDFDPPKFEPPTFDPPIFDPPVIIAQNPPTVIGGTSGTLLSTGLSVDSGTIHVTSQSEYRIKTRDYMDRLPGEAGYVGPPYADWFVLKGYTGAKVVDITYPKFYRDDPTNTFINSLIIPSQPFPKTQAYYNGIRGVGKTVSGPAIKYPMIATHLARTDVLTISKVFVDGKWYDCVNCNIILPSSPPGAGPAPGLGGPTQLRLYGSEIGSGTFAGVNAATSWGGGYRVSDTAGLSSGVAPTYRSIVTGAGFSLVTDASRPFDLDANQRLRLGLVGDFQHRTTNLATSALTTGGPNGNAAFVKSNVGTITGLADYTIANVYLRGRGSFDATQIDITNNIRTPGARGRTNGRGVSVDATVGHYFPLANTTGVGWDRLRSSSPAPASGYALYLDASGHLGYRRSSYDAFTDSSGLQYGEQRVSYGEAGARARLVALVPNRGQIWMSYLGVLFDQKLGYKATVDVPAQGATPADTLSFFPSTTFWGVEGGVNLLSRANAKFGVSAFYYASADAQNVGGSAFLRIPLWDKGPPDSGIRVVGLPVKAEPRPPFANWSGLYVGAHVGGSLSVARFADPLGTPVFGDVVNSPAFFGGGQIGYNWQALGSRWVFGLETDASIMDSDGSNSCFAVAANVVNTTCRVRPRLAGTVTGRIGYAFDSAGRTLLYGKGGFAWSHNEIDMTLNAGGNNPARAAALASGSNQSITLWGGTLGAGVERALTPAWSLKLEYDYVRLRGDNVSNLGFVTVLPNPPYTVNAFAPGTSGISQSLHQVKLGLNYKWGTDPWAAGWTAPLARASAPAAGWELEAGGRFVTSWSRFSRTFGLLKELGLPELSDLSRLTYDDMQSTSGEFFGRIDTPWNVFVKGYAGRGNTKGGRLNDEDNIIIFGLVVAAYSNTLSPAVTGKLSYAAIDSGYNVLRGPGYKLGVFAGYFTLDQEINAFGCIALASINCTGSLPTTGSPVIIESNKWRAVRLGIAGETMVTERVKLVGEVAYLPWVRFEGVDQHFIGNTGVLAEVFPSSGKGGGVQLEALVSYYVTPQWSVGIGGRYWAMWTAPGGEMSCTFGCGGGTTPPQFSRVQFQHMGAFVQSSYRFDWSNITGH